MTRTSFTSKHFPSNRNRLFILQEYAVQYYAAFTLVVMLGVMLSIANGKGGRDLILWTVIGELLALALANLMAGAKLKRSYAQITFIGDHFSLISVHDILYDNKNHAFPLRFANAQRGEDRIQIHYNDQIITLDRDEWDDFDLIWNYLIAAPSDTGSGWQMTIS